ncbi:ZIP family metal transporter [Candidatus Pacearchaeota archaeon]|nr:ZIP family metal transporter [Candidatus Pacearchaeota archaeon]
MLEIWLYTFASVLVVSLISFVGLITLSIKTEKLQKILIYFISFSAGALFADAFLHLLPGIAKNGVTASVSFSILLGIIIFFTLEKLVHWQHCHMPITKTHVHRFAIMNLIGDGFHNFLDGLIIGASYLISIPAGAATSLAVILHEIPQEIGDFGVLIHGGYSKRKALTLNFLSALTAFAGAIAALLISNSIHGLEKVITSIAIGGFIYIAGSDLIPELHKDFTTKKAILQLLFFLIGIGILAALLLLE